MSTDNEQQAAAAPAGMLGAIAESVQRWVANNTISQTFGPLKVSCTAPFRTPLGDLVEVLFEVAGLDQILVHDGGEAAHCLEMQGAPLTADGMTRAKRLAHDLGLRWADERFQATVGMEGVPLAFEAVARATVQLMHEALGG